MGFSELLAQGIFASYFLVILLLFVLILKAQAPSLSANRGDARLYVFASLTILSFAYTWYYMVQFLLWSFAQYERSSPVPLHAGLSQRVTSWLMHSGLFEQAWASVCSHPLNWWWSEPICLFTVGAWTAFVALQGRRFGVKHLWAYMLLGQLVAISVAANLFHLALLFPPLSHHGWRVSPAKAVPPALWLSVLVALLTVALTPFTSTQTFLPNLLLMHALTFVPILIPSPSASPSAPRTALSMKPRTLYILSAAACTAIRIRTTLAALSAPHSHPASLSPAALSTFANALWTTLRAHPAQSSIGWDVIWTGASFLAWIVIADTERGGLRLRVRPERTTLRGSSAYVFLTGFVTALLSPGVGAPVYLAVHAREDEREDAWKDRYSATDFVCGGVITMQPMDSDASSAAGKLGSRLDS